MTHKIVIPCRRSDHNDSRILIIVSATLLLLALH